MILAITLLIGTGVPPALAATGVSGAGAPPALAATGVSVVDLGLLPGGIYASARAINNLGQVAGAAYDASGALVQVIWTDGTIITLPGSSSWPWTPEAINDSRQVVGNTHMGRGASSGILSDVNGQVFELPPVPGGDVQRVMAHDINASGFIAGRSRDASLGYHCALWQGTTLSRDLGFMGSGNVCEAYGINDLGDIVGVANSVSMGQTRGFLWRDGSFTDLGSLAGPSGASTAVDINNSGLIAGTSNGGIAAVWRNGVIETLPALPGGTTYNFVTDLNNNGDVVGYGQSPSGVHLDTPILWRGGTAIDLGRWPGGTFSRGYGMNDNGQIVGEGNLVDGGPVHALMWTIGAPPPPPAVSLRSLTLNPTQVSGGSPSTGSVALSAAAPSGGLVVGLSSSNPSVAGVPASVTVAQGATSASFSVATTPVGGSTTVTISATSAGITKTATLTVTPPATADTVAIKVAQYRASGKKLAVQATSTSASATLTAYVTATGQRIGPLVNNGGGNHSAQFSWPSNPQNITVRSNLGGSATKAATPK